MSVSATPEGQPLKGEATVLEPGRGERSLARRSAETRATVPDLELGADLDAGAALALAGADGGSLEAVLVRACALALRSHPRANAAYRDGHYELYSRVNVAVSVSVEDGAVSPTVLDADTKPVDAIAAELATLRELAQAGQLTPPEQAGATFTLSLVTDSRVARASALIVPPQAAALAAGSVQSAPILRGGAVEAGYLLSLTLACDSRILFGPHAAAFLDAIVAQLE